jgi:hypothetical protein
MQEAYAQLLDNSYQVSWARFDLMNKLGRLRAEVYDRSDPDTELTDSPEGYFYESDKEQFLTTVDTLASNFALLPAKLPNFIRWHQCKLTFHANYFARRLRHLCGDDQVLSPHLPADQCCFLCGTGPDSFRHVHFTCHITQRAERMLLLKHGFLPYHKTLDTLLLTDTTLSKKLLLFRVFFSYTVYKVRCQVETQNTTPTNPQHIITSFENTAFTYCPTLIGQGHKRVKALTPLKTKAIARVKQLLLTLDNDTILCYTDGSANPNPGHSGAGIFITYRNFTYTTYTSLVMAPTTLASSTPSAWLATRSQPTHVS